ncbi:MAG TPA: thioredoxin domain-containing protein, partial [Nitrososphaera sp.]|nr:thioredoxin domain-containing protein [Nitrososphaera sp.]
MVLLLLCLGCSAQAPAPQVNQRIERQVRAFYNIPAEVKIDIGKREPSEFPNYDKVTLTLSSGEHKQTNDFLIAKDDKTLIRFTKIDLTTDPYADIMKKLDVSGRPIRGNKDAKVTIVNFDDFECPFCSRMHQTLFPDILKSYGDRVRIIYKDFPLKEIHPWAVHAAVDANCLAAQNNDAYWDLADYIHAHQK